LTFILGKNKKNAIVKYSYQEIVMPYICEIIAAAGDAGSRDDVFPATLFQRGLSSGFS
jgi:hypothetical protein